MTVSRYNDHFNDITVAGKVNPSEQTTVTGDWTPDVDDEFTLGTPTKRWKEIHVDDIYGSLVSASGVNPWDATITYDAGQAASYGGYLWLSLNGTNLANTPGLYPTYWRKLTPLTNYDITAYGARYIPTNISFETTATMTSGSTAVTLAGASQFQDGDGIAIYGAGATHAMSTPSAPTVAPKLAGFLTSCDKVENPPAGGATTYNYKIIARNTASGYTAASSAGTTTTGNATLGQQSVTITSIARSSKACTVTTASAHGLAVGAVVQITGCADPSFTGWYAVASSADNTHFVFNGAMDTRAGATTSTTGGTVYWFNCNRVSWSSVSGAWIYDIYKDSGASYDYIGSSRPHGASVSELYFDDYGSTMIGSPNRPTWVPSSATAVAVPDCLVTTIVSGGGTTSLVVADASSNATTNAVTNGTNRAIFTIAPAWTAADTAARANGATVYFPPTPAGQYGYVLGSYLSLGAGSTIVQSGSLYLSNTLKLIDAPNWIALGYSGGNGATQFGYTPGATVSCAAFPSVYMYAANGASIIGPRFSWTGTNDALLMCIDATSNILIHNCGFTTGTTNADNNGISICFRSPGDTHQNTISNTRFSGGPNQNYGQSWTPQVMTIGAVGNTKFYETYWNRRGFSCTSTSPYINSRHSHLQGFITPYISNYNTSGSYWIEESIGDTSGAPMFANLTQYGTNPFAGDVTLINSYPGGAETGGAAPCVTGAHCNNLTVLSNQTAPPGQNFGIFRQKSTALHVPVFSPAPLFINSAGPVTAAAYEAAGSMYFPAQHTLYFSNGFKPTSVAGSDIGGGSMTAETYYYKVSAISADGGEGEMSESSDAIVVGASGKVRLTWTGIAGAVAYTVRRRNSAQSNFNARVGIQVAAATYDDAGTVYEASVAAPDGPGTGKTSLGDTQLVVPKVILYGGLSSGVSYKHETSIATQTANHTHTIPDANTVAVQALSAVAGTYVTGISGTTGIMSTATLAIPGPIGGTTPNTGVFTALSANRLKTNQGTAQTSGNIALSAGWGSGAAVGSVSGYDQVMYFTVTAGTTPSASPTITITFADGTWTNVPGMLLHQVGGNDVQALTDLITESATAPAWTWLGTPTDTKTYRFLLMCVGK